LRKVAVGLIIHYEKTNLKMKKQIALTLITLAFIGCNNSAEPVVTKNAIATIIAKSGSNASGTLKFSETNKIVKMTISLSGLTPGNQHAIHIHALGDCSAVDGSSAGGHWNPTNKSHGVWGGGAPFHLGDIGNMVADTNGNATFTRGTDLWCIDCEDENKNIVGKAIILHAGFDDFSGQPSGNAGARIGCGAIVLE
jgi:Cu-Zn family superoxide dismutase